MANDIKTINFQDEDDPNHFTFFIVILIFEL